MFIKYAKIGCRMSGGAGSKGQRAESREKSRERRAEGKGRWAESKMMVGGGKCEG